MKLNTLKPGAGSRKQRKRLGRGHSAGGGKTCGRGHKGQHARAGGYHKVGFEGGQLPLQRRVPKIGFRSPRVRDTAEVRLHELDLPGFDVIDVEALKEARVIPVAAKKARVIASGTIERAVTLQGVHVTPGARKAIEAAGGTIRDTEKA